MYVTNSSDIWRNPRIFSRNPSWKISALLHLFQLTFVSKSYNNSSFIKHLISNLFQFTFVLKSYHNASLIKHLISNLFQFTFVLKSYHNASLIKHLISNLFQLTFVLSYYQNSSLEVEVTKTGSPSLDGSRSSTTTLIHRP